MASSLPFVLAPLPTFEDEEVVQNHLYQKLDKPGPRGAYEARQADGGLYVRVDMPGVPPDGVKVVKRGESRTVTFTGKAPKQWPSDSSDRVYGGYVVLDRDPCEIDVEMSVVNGCLRLFFPGADGILHSLNSRPIKLADEAFDVFPGAAKYFNGEAPVLPTRKQSHINPFLLDGIEGVYEIKPAYGLYGGELTYLRVDMPGISEENYVFQVVGNRMNHGGEGNKDHRLDQGGRVYRGCLTWMCDCCEMSPQRMVDMKDGVLRVMFGPPKTRFPPYYYPRTGPCSMALGYY